MPLPISPLPRDSIEIAGTTVEYRSLSRSEALKMQTFAGREDEAEVWLLTCGTGCTEDEARAFRDGNDTDTAGLLIDAIIVISGLTRKSAVPADGRRTADPKAPAPQPMNGPSRGVTSTRSTSPSPSASA